MELPKFNKPDGMLSSIKSKLGFASDQPQDAYRDQYYDEDYEDYGDYGHYGDDYADDQYGGYIPAGSRGPSERGSHRSDTSPRLVSIDDVRANTQIPDSLNRDPLPSRRNPDPDPDTARGYRAGGSFQPRKVEHASDYLRSTDTSDLPQGSGGGARSQGYDSLFSPTAASAGPVPARQASGAGAYDPYDSYAGTGVSSHAPSRSLNVLKPMSYSEVERIAKTVKAGDVVVLGLYNTPDQLAKRILDFSFGVSSALDASVECVADKVFVIIRGNGLSPEERMSLRNQGIL